jgi:hypothetical protein
MNKRLTNIGLIAAGLMNIGGVMSNFGLLMIVVWGLAYLGAATVTSSIRWIAGAFAVEKLVYVVVWCKWLSANSLAELYAKDLFAGVFFSIYGANDLVFMLFFAWVFFLKQPSR